MIHGEGNSLSVPSLDLLTFLFGKPLIPSAYTLFARSSPGLELNHASTPDRLRTLHRKR